MPEQITVPDYVLLYAFRYALGRHSGAPDDVAVELERHAALLPQWMREQVVRDITQALAREEAGHWQDIRDRWRLCRDRLHKADPPVVVETPSRTS